MSIIQEVDSLILRLEERTNIKFSNPNKTSTNSLFHCLILNMSIANYDGLT